MNNAGTWWLKGAWIELGLEQAVLNVIGAACQRHLRESGPPLRVLTHAQEVLVVKNETLVFLPLFENVTRLAHLDTYDDDGLGWLTESARVYCTKTMEIYLSELTRLKIATALGQALARCYWQAWYQDESIPDRHVFYVDMHDKVVWTKKPSPVGYIGALHEVHACLKQAFVHGHGGHPLLCVTYPADVHLSGVVTEVALALDHPDNLIALITTVSRADEPDIRRVVRWYLERWNAQENSFRDQIAFVHLNINFGLQAKRAVPDRRIARRITDLTAHLEAVKRKLDSKIVQLTDLERRIQNLTARYDEKVADLLRPRKRQGPQAAARAAKRERRLRDYRERHQHRLTRYLARKVKLEQAIEAHRQEQARTADRLTQLDPNATFFEVDTEKDQIMAHLRVGLHNSALWARNHYFGSTYRYTTPLTLWRIFFNQDGFYKETTDCIVITLGPFTDPHVRQEAVEACRRLNERQIKTMSDKIIEMRVADCI